MPFCLSAVLLPIPILLVVLWGITQMHYVIDDRFVRVLLWGFTLRKIALTDIEGVDTKVVIWNEHWCNTLFAWGRSVRIRRRTGIAHSFIITPANRDEFIQQLQERLTSGGHRRDPEFR